MKYSSNASDSPFYPAVAWQALWGIQVINLSGFEKSTNIASCGAYDTSAHPHCQAINIAAINDVTYVASSGNNLSIPIASFSWAGTHAGGVNFPARNENVIAVGGIDVRDCMWDERYPVPPTFCNWAYPSYGDFSTGDFAGCPEYTVGLAPIECGSNVSLLGSQQQDFVAPSRRVLSTVPIGSTYDPRFADLCNDANFGAPDDGYAVCSGTSMSAPLVSGIVALVRSVNPLLSRSSVYNLLKETASEAGVYSLQRGWGKPSARFAVEGALGKIAGATVVNRLTPVFALRNTMDSDRLYTTRPQLATGALSGIYLTDVNSYCYGASPIACSGEALPGSGAVPRPYFSSPSTEGHSPLEAYPEYRGYKQTETRVPRAAFWVFTSDKSLWGRVGLKALHRLSFAEACDWRDHIYTTDTSFIDLLTGTDWCPSQSGNQPFQYDAIEGYVLENCPREYDCNGIDPSAPQKLFRRYSYVDQSSALLLESQLALPAFSSYATDAWGGGTGLLGYVFPNIDSDNDGLPDGMEGMYGMNPFSVDSDCDGISDGLEFPVAVLQPVGFDPLSGSCE